MAKPVLVIDLGSSGITAALVSEEGEITKRQRVEFPPLIPADGLAEYDPVQLADIVLSLAGDFAAAKDGAEGVSAVGITDHRASTMIWERKTGIPAGNMISWQDLRTVPECLELQSKGLRLLPNQPATKLAHLLQQVDNPGNYCFGTPESWLVWILTKGELHITDASHAALSGMVHLDGSGWDSEILEILEIPEAVLPEIVDSIGFQGEASALYGAPPIKGLIGDQQASLIGQGCTKRGAAKMTFGTSGVLNVCTLENRPDFDLRGENGSFPIVAWRESGQNFWGIEAIMLSAGSTIDWATKKMQLADSIKELESVIETSVCFVPALAGLGAPYWDFGARGTFLGMQLSTDESELAHAVLAGIANSGADICEAGRRDAGISETGFECLRIDGGMSRNTAFTQYLADACGRPLEISSEPDSTSLGAAYLAGIGAGIWKDLDATAELYVSAEIVHPNPDSRIREGWNEAVQKARGWHPDLSGIEF